MPAYPVTAAPLVITPWSRWSIGKSPLQPNTQMDATASAAWPSANLAIYVPFFTPVPFIAANMFTMNGATASGNIDIGIYAADGTRLVSKGSTAQAGTSQTQAFAVSAVLAPGDYYMALAMDGTTGTAFRSAINARLAETLGCFTQAAAFPLPANATFAAYSQAYLPVFGVTSRSFV